MPRTRKPRQSADPDESASSHAVNPPPAEAEAEVESRPSQLNQIRAALASDPAGGAEMPELPAPAAEEALELEAHVEEPVPSAEPTQPVAAPPSAWVPPPTHPPRPPQLSRVGTSPMGTRSSLALGIVLVVVGVFFLVMRIYDIDLSTYGWPLYVIIPGLTLLVVGFVSLGSGAIIPGGILTMTGLVLAYQNSTGDWASWSYAWALVMPGGVGLGIFLAGLRNRDPKQLRQGRSLIFWSVLIFMIGFVFFESILGVSGVDYGIVGRAALPALLIVIGVMLLVRNFRRQQAVGPTTSAPPTS